MRGSNKKRTPQSRERDRGGLPGPDRGEWQLEGQNKCLYCGGSYKFDKFTIPEAMGGFCMPECVSGYTYYILRDSKGEYQELIEQHCNRKVNRAPPHGEMRHWDQKNGWKTQEDVYNIRYKGLSEKEKAQARKEIGDKRK